MANKLEAGFARADVTPLMGIGISGYYVDRFAQGVLDPLEVNAVALRCGGDACVMVSVDNCGLAPTAVYTAHRPRVGVHRVHPYPYLSLLGGGGRSHGGGLHPVPGGPHRRRGEGGL